MSTQTSAHPATHTTQAISPAARRFAPPFIPPLPSRFNLPLSLVLALCLMAAWFSLRLGLWISLGSERPGGMDFMQALLLGGWFDAWSITYLLAPLFLLSALLPNRLRLSRAAGWGRKGLLWLGLALGWIQQMRGAQFLSHTLVSAWLACLIGYLLIWCYERKLFAHH